MKQIELKKRLLNRYGNSHLNRIVAALHMIDESRLIKDSLDKIEMEMQRELGHWSDHNNPALAV